MDFIQSLPLWSIFFYLFLGFITGLFSGLLGIGGGWLITPALNLWGMQMITAVGTALTQMVGLSLIGFLKRLKQNEADITLGISLAIPVTFGIYSGKSLMIWLSGLGFADSFARITLSIILACIGISMLKKEEKKKKNSNENFYSFKALYSTKKINPKKILITISFLLILYFIGILSSIAGIGGGIILVPIMTIMLKIPLKIASGTSLFVILCASTTGSILYGAIGASHIPSAILLMIGGSIGAYLGVVISSQIETQKLRRIFASLAFASGCALILKQADLGFYANIVLFSTAGILIALLIYQIMLSFLIKGKKKNSYI